MSVQITDFGKTKEGQKVSLYTISNGNGMKVSVTDYGANLVSLIVPDKKGGLRDVVLGYGSVEGYFESPSFFGAVVGPSANRIADAKVTIEGKVCQLDVNDGPNNLHSHKDLGFHKRMWRAESSEQSVTFTIEDEDGSLGFPGNKKLSVTYTLDEENALTLHYHGSSDRKTVLNPTNHSYFNLKGHDQGNIEDHVLMLCASRYTPVAEGSIPTGEIAPVAGTVMDFTAPKRIGDQIDDPCEQLLLTGGYDHNFAIDGWDGTLRPFGTVKSPDGLLEMKGYTTLPGVQFYAGNLITPEPGKGGAFYEKRSGFCLETQYFPNSANEKNFESCIFGGDREYDSVTVYRFC